MHKSPSDLAKFMKEKREKSGFSQKQIADKLGYTTPQFISNWERGVSNPPVKVIKKLAALYDISVDDIFKVVLQTTLSEVSSDLKKKFYGKKSS